MFSKRLEIPLWALVTAALALAGAGAFAEPQAPVVSVVRGVQVDNLTMNAIQQLGLSPTTVGVLVTAVDGGTPAAAAGLRPNDVVLEVNSSTVFNVLDFQKAVAALGANSATLRVNRRGNILFVMIPVQ